MIQVPPCYKCGQLQAVKLRRIICSNNTSLVGWRCTDCDQWAEKPTKWLSHRWVQTIMQRYGKTLEDLPAVADHRAKDERQGLMLWSSTE